MFKKVGAVALSALFLAGCTSTPEVEDIPVYQENPTARAFEDGEAEKRKIADEEEALAAETANMLKSTEGTANLPNEVKRAHELLLAASFFVENTKTSDGYEKYLYYETNSTETVKMLFVPYLSSSKSYCIQAISLQDEDFGILYDSQQKRVLKNGESCKPALGNAWGSIENSDEELSNAN